MSFDYEVLPTENSLDVIWVEQNYNKFIFHINFSRLSTINLPIRALLMHEIFHVKQYLNRFPMLVLTSPSANAQMIQNVITDYFVTCAMVDRGHFEDARDIFCHRLSNSQTQRAKEDLSFLAFKLGQLDAEAKFFPDAKQKLFEAISALQNDAHRDLITRVSGLLTVSERSGEREGIVTLYRELLTLVEPNAEIVNFDSGHLLVSKT